MNIILMKKKIEILKKIIADDVIIVIEISSKSKTPIISFLEIFNEKIIAKTMSGCVKNT